MDTPTTEKLTKLLAEKKSAREFQERKHEDWNENYELYRNKVRTNRLTQRQAVNIPLMKETIKTLMSRVDDAPTVNWKENSGDEVKELIYQEIWDEMYRTEDLELKDILDKKNVFLYGLSTKKLNLKYERICVDILDVFDVIYDPKTHPLDVETAKYIVQQNIFRPLRDILVDDRYTKEGRDELKIWANSEQGLIQSGKNKEEFEKRMERLKSMGVQHEDFPLWAGGDVLVNLTEHFTELWNPKTEKFERHVIVYADDTIELSDDLLKDAIGIEEWPFDFWSEDPETNDIYPDGVADLVRTPNKILNVWFSQQVENRTLQNFQMHWFDATVQGYQPQTYEPGPGRMLPAPGKPQDTIMPVQINGLDETFTAIDFLTNIVERGTGATALEKGEADSQTQTLGEVQILVGNSAERAKTMAKFYKGSWYRLAKKWDKMMQANADTIGKMTLHKTGISGKVFEKVVYPSDWTSEAGYEPTIASSSEQEADELKTIQKYQAVLQMFPENVVLRRIAQSRQLQMLDLTAAELKEVQEEELRMQEMAEQQAQMEAQMAQQQPQQAPQEAPEEDVSPLVDQIRQTAGV